ncbi:Major histocompatibility complex class I-related gene protein [Varanus komodoensis]|nr:Major histocompatibility complex class I-related gene protein [Varanus komodoensis]
MKNVLRLERGAKSKQKAFFTCMGKTCCFSYSVKDDKERAEGLNSYLGLIFSKKKVCEFPGQGFHTWQMMAGCEENNGKPRGRYLRFGYDGRDFLSLDVETFNWTAADAMAQITKRNWEANPSVTQRFRDYVEETCAEWIQAELVHGKERLQRRNPPEIKVTQKEVHGGLETLICVARGFYPKEIDMAWTRDGKVWVQNTSHGFLTPFTESTYYYWLGIKISSKDRMHYQCRVKHDGLQNTLDKAWNEFEDSSPSVFHTIYTAVSEPGPVLPQFMAVVFVGDLPIARYDSNSRKVWYEAKWMEKLLEVHHEYQRKYEEMLQRDGADFTAGLRAVQATHNQSAGSPFPQGLLFPRWPALFFGISKASPEQVQEGRAGQPHQRPDAGEVGPLLPLCRRLPGLQLWRTPSLQLVCSFPRGWVARHPSRS